MADSPIQAAAEAVTEGFSNWDPQNAGDLVGFFQQFPEFFDELARGVGALAAKAGDELPLHPSVTEGIQEMASTLAGLHDHAEELNGHFRQAHERELERLDAPRPQEELWDVKNQ